ncbi:MAG: DUF2793 domain-containing protein [Hyphomicrobiales bacterium]
MSDTVHLGLPLIHAAQAQKHVTHNEALAIADQLVHLSVISRALASPPVSPSDGDRYLVAPGALGLWSAHDGELAFFLDGAWRFAVPRTGWRLWSAAEAKLLLFDGVLWRDLQDIDELDNMDRLGINATADATNRLAVASAGALFTHEGADHRLKINKNSAADTASLVLQSNFSGRAEIGLPGDDDLHIKVSPDGGSWTEALKINRTSGQAQFASGVVRIDGIGIGIGANPTSSLRFLVQGTGAEIATFAVQGESAANGNIRRYSNDGNGPALILRKARGTIANAAAPSQNDVCSDINAGYWDGVSAFVTNSTLRTTIRAASPSAADGEARFTGLLCPAGSASLSEVFRFEHATGFSMFGSNILVTQNRHFRKRQYAAGSLPAQNSGDEIASSDIVAASLVSDGTEWLSPGVKRLRAVSANTTLSIPAGWAIDKIHYAETAGNAVTGGIKIGTSSGGSDVVSAQAVGANALDTVADGNVLKKVFSRSSAQTLFVQAVTAWNAASVELSFVLRKVF